MAYVPPLNGGRINASISGNTAGVLTAVSTGTMVLAGGNNVTLSQNANSITISGAAQSNQSLGIYGTGANTFGTSSSALDGRSISISGVGAVNVGFSTDSIFRISVPAQTNQTLSFSAGSQSTLTATGTFDARSYFLNGVGAASIGFSANSVFVSVPSQTVESQSIGMHTSTAGGGTGGTSGSASGGQIRYNFYAGSNITLSQSVNGASGSLSLFGTSGAAQTVESQSIGMHTSTAGGGTGGTSGSASGGQIRYNFYAGSNITLSQSVNGASGSLSLFGTSGGGGGGAALSAGTQSVNTGTVNFANSNGITFGMSGSNQITASYTVPTQSVQTLGLYMSSTDRTIGQSSSTTLDARSINFSGLGAISAGFSGSTMQLSVPATSSLVGANGMSVSTNGSTISIMPLALTAYTNMFPMSTTSQTFGVLGVTSGSPFFFPISVESVVQFNALRIAMGLSYSSSSVSGQQSITHSYGLYSNNANTLSLISSSNLSYAITNSSVSATVSLATATGTGGYSYGTTSGSTTAQLQSMFGTVGMYLQDLQFGNTMSVTPGMYWIGLLHKASSSSANVGVAFGLAGNATPTVGKIGTAATVLTNNSALRAPYVGWGPYNASSNALPGSAAISSITHSLSILPTITLIST